MKNPHSLGLGILLAGLLGLAGAASAAGETMPAAPGSGMWQPPTPEQRQQMWEYMQRQGYGPGMMMGPGMMGPWWGPSPAQRQQMWDAMQRQGYGPGMMMGWQAMTPEQYRQWWEQTHPAPPADKK